VNNAFGNEITLLGMYLDGSVSLQVDNQVPTQGKEEFVFPVMFMPVILPVQYAKPHHGFIHLA
jgi:hypothetical protein